MVDLVGVVVKSFLIHQSCLWLATEIAGHPSHVNSENVQNLQPPLSDKPYSGQLILDLSPAAFVFFGFCWVMARPCFPANIWKNVIHEKMKCSFLQQEFFVVFAFYQKGLSIALPCLLVNLNKSMGLRLEFAIRNMRLCCTLAHCSTSTSVKTNRPIGHPQKKHWTCGPKMTKFILKKMVTFQKCHDLTWHLYVFFQVQSVQFLLLTS